jgi:ABC-2 type transport system permease protein
MSPLMRQTWRDDRRAIIGWTVGVTAFTAIYTSFYSSFQGAAQLKDDALPEGMKSFLSINDMTPAAGYLQATVYSLVGLLLLIMCGLLLIARTIPRPEEDGGIELLMVNPLSRRAFATQRLAATGVTVTAIAAIPWLVVTLIARRSGSTCQRGTSRRRRRATRGARRTCPAPHAAPRRRPLADRGRTRPPRAARPRRVLGRGSQRS